MFVVRCGQSNILEVSQQHLLEVLGIDRMPMVRIMFSFKETVTTYDLQALFITIQSGEAQDLNDFLAVCKIISRNGGYKYCPGLDENEYHNQFYSVIRYHIKSVRLWEIPFKRVDSRNCIIWHQLSAYATLKEKSSDVVLCKACKRLQSDLDYQKHQSDVSPKT